VHRLADMIQLEPDDPAQEGPTSLVFRPAVDLLAVHPRERLVANDRREPKRGSV